MKRKKVVLKTLAALAIASLMTLGGAEANAKTYESEQGLRYEGLMEDGSTYKGQMEDGKRNGIGTNFYPDGSRLDGAWYNDKAEGNVVVTYKDGSCFKGSYRAGEKNGLGVMIDADGEKTAGIWKDDKITNRIMSTEKDNKTYYMENGNDIHGGNGIVFYPNGDIYIGNLIGDKSYEEGKGAFYYSDGSWYTGDWENGKADGTGIFYDTIPDDVDLSAPYIKCTWENGKRTGWSIWYKSDGSRIIGDFTNDSDTYNGLVVNIDPNGITSIAEWENGKPKSNKPSVWKDSKGNQGVGSRVNGQLYGYGVYVVKNSNINIGNFEGGNLNDDKGLNYFIDKDYCYIGTFKKGTIEGNGTIWRPPLLIKVRWKIMNPMEMASHLS